MGNHPLRSVTFTVFRENEVVSSRFYHHCKRHKQLIKSNIDTLKMKKETYFNLIWHLLTPIWGTILVSSS